MTPTQQTTIDGYAQRLQSLCNFLQKYNVPEECGIMFPTFPDGDITVYLSCNKWESEEQHNKKLSLMGEAFGTDGWEARQVSVTQFNWRKFLDGVRIDLDGAKQMPEPLPQPVRPNEFPLQLTEVAQ